MAGNLSDKGLSSDDEPGKRSFSVAKASAAARTGPTFAQKDKELSSSSDEMPTEAQKVGRPSERTGGTERSDSIQTVVPCPLVLWCVLSMAQLVPSRFRVQ